MVFHIAGWSASVDQAAPAAIAALADPSLTVAGNNIQVPDFCPYLLGAFGIGVNLTQMELQSPSLRRIINFDVMPFTVAATPGNYPMLSDLYRNQIALDVGEQVQCLTSEDGAGATRMNGFILFGDGKPEDITDPIYSIRVTAATTLGAFVWTNAPLTFGQALPVGNYAVVGAKFFSAGLLAFRFVFQGQTPRPGGIGGTAVSAEYAPGQRRGGWGNWGMFNSNTPPTVDFLSSSADAAETGVIDLVFLGA